MTIQDIIAARHIESVLHFTSNRGSLGVLAAGALKARRRLDADAQLKHIFYPNARDRSRDAAWHDYVNLSITRINEWFFQRSAGSWHKEQDFWWCILDFSPEILSHDGVVFTTTNNIYTGVSRGEGAAGLDALFAPQIVRWRGNVVTRQATDPPNFTTCSQAEVLYPGEVSTRFLQRVYVSQDKDGDELAGQIAMIGHPKVEILTRPELFEAIK